MGVGSDVEWKASTVLEHTEGTVFSVAFHPRGMYLVSSGADGRVTLWAWEDGRALLNTVAHQGPILAMALHRSGEWLVTGGLDQAVRLWRWKQETTVRKSETQTGS